MKTDDKNPRFGFIMTIVKINGKINVMCSAGLMVH